MTIGGKSIKPNQLAAEFMKVAVEQFSAELRERFSAIRHPETGEFPTVVILGKSFDELTVRVEGSPELIALVRKKMSVDELDGIMLETTDSPRAAPKVFLSYASEDTEDARCIAQALIGQGIDTWWADWSLGAGDSIRQKIEEGLGDCTHFVVLLTPTSIDKPWVKTEIDAGFVGKVESRCKFIPLRKGLKVGDLSPLLRTVISPSLDSFDEAITQLVSDIHGITRKPPIGPSPAAESQNESYSLAANQIARYFVEKSETARFADPQITVEALAIVLSMTIDDVRDGLHELRSFFRKIQFDRVMPEDALFVEFDAHFTKHSPAQDALTLAIDLMNDENFPTGSQEIAKHYAWEPRRLNPALAYLIQRGLIGDGRVINSGKWLVPYARKNAEPLRRFVKSRT